MRADDAASAGARPGPAENAVTAAAATAFNAAPMIRSIRVPRVVVLAAVFGMAASAFAGEPSAPRPGGARPAPSAAQQQNLAQLKSDLAAIKAGSTVTPIDSRSVTA